MTRPAGPRQAAFVELVEQHAHILQKVARAYCPFAAQRPDLVQEMTIALWRSFERYDPSRPFGTWMYRIALNVAISFFRSESRHAVRLTPLDDIERAGEPAFDDPRIGSLLECIDDLGPLDKALILMYLDGYPHADVAGVLGISTSNAATKLARIKQRLRAAMTAPEKGAIH
ncbi:MAG TPA: sigma-70 family RNA polymerase sigma factor [Candidatus Baltobacteraceae bacterium]